jgi:outer membrane receptor protein involved in Fe transport
LQAWVELPAAGLLDGSMLTLGARNVFDETPEFAHAGGSLGHDISQNNLTGRLIYLRLGKRF